MKSRISRKFTAVLTAAFIFMAVAGAAAFSLGKYEKVKAANGEVVIPAAKVANGKAHFYKFEDNGKEIAFFVVKASDGSIKSAFDACDSCYRDKKGYEQQGDKMNCKNCNQKFVINRIGPNATGGCNPGYLPNKQTGGNVVISVADLKGGAKFF
ncbi:MAG: DUF2318 domain-containing protein [Geobacter sp.]|nr:DUF2318 domain-containing protein [Geobacter sp.]